MKQQVTATRALIVVRLSRVTEATTSPERQLQECRDLCAQRGYEVVGVAEDLDVSAGKTTPFERAALKGWIGLDGRDDPGRSHEYDVIVVWRVDRIVRRLFDLADLIRWCQRWDVALVSATEQFIDLTHSFGDMIALLVAKVAEMELAAISERNRSAARSNLQAGKYRGGVPPWGYLPDKIDGEWRLVPDKVQSDEIAGVVKRVLAGDPLRAIAHDMTERGVLTPRDRLAQVKGREVKGYAWHSGPLKRALTNQALLGYVMSGDEPIRNDDGSPVVRSAPILSREVFDRLGVELASRENRKEPTKRSTALLLQVIYCGVCGRPAYRLKGGKGRTPRYRCASAQYKVNCGNRSIPLSEADDIVEQLVLGMLGESERLERVWDSGSDHTAELDEINSTLVDLTGLIGTAAYGAGTPQRAALDRRIEGLAARQAELSAEEVKPSGWAWQPTGEKFGDWWARQDVVSKNVWLRSMNVHLGFTYSLDGGRRSADLDLGDLQTLTQQLKPTGAVARWQEIFAAMTDSGVQGIELGSGEPKIVRE
ncbi:recombinase family protein [Mycobacterium sp. SMC-4]|uniref:recombinase family protein n=1 Tax=Mycobacterium sp. SMC-4 TaxID=2857059 RepID=UPI0021B21610|nr:recombinase family protein [Mycobacterium sp. SMC-4]UXA17652.1 recombinase family protein [Mycobacterium sp. SMC-4]